MAWLALLLASILEAACPRGTMTIARWGAPGSEVKEEWPAYESRLLAEAVCKPCPRGAVSVTNSRGWTFCVGGAGDGCRGMHVETNRKSRPLTCVPCPPTLGWLPINGVGACLPDICQPGLLPVPVMGRRLTYECRPSLEKAESIDWQAMRPESTQPALSCPGGHGVVGGRDNNWCESCVEDGLGLVKRAGSLVCGKNVPVSCKHGWGAVLHPLTWQPVACTRCPLLSPAKQTGNGYALCTRLIGD